MPFRFLRQISNISFCLKSPVTFLILFSTFEGGKEYSIICVFIDWLKTYADLSKHNITAEELWEYRNGLIHMTNLDSKKVSKGNVCRILLFPCGVKNFIKKIDLNEKTLDMPLLLKETIPLALSKWFHTYNVDRNKIESFVERYDLIVSDSRLAILNV